MKKILLLIVLFVAFTKATEFYGPFKAYDTEILKKWNISTSYAYAPSTIFYKGEFHQFYCTTGGVLTDFYFVHPEPNAYKESWDHIAYRTSKNGSTWSSPRVVLTQSRTTKGKNERCACDPAIIRHGKYWYLYYTGNLPAKGTVEYVARSESIKGPFMRLTERGTWELWPDDPKVILQTAGKMKKESRDGVKAKYGLGQLSVVKKGNTFHFWFQDTNEDNDDSKGEYATFKHTTSSSPYNLPAASKWETISLDGKNKFIAPRDFGDVKYNPLTGNFELWIFSGYYTEDNVRIQQYKSKNGVTWNKTSEDFGGPYKHVSNLGVSGDSIGNILNNRYIISFAAPQSSPTNQNQKCNATTMVNECFPWSMWEIFVGGKQSSKQNIPYGYTFPVSSQNLEFINGDFDGDGVTDLAAVDRKTSQWYIRSSKTRQKGIPGFPWGWKWAGMGPNHKIVCGDYDGDGKTDLTIVNEKEGLWYMISTGTGSFLKVPTGTEIFGWKWEGMNAHHKILSGDYDGDGITDRTIVDEWGNWYIISSKTGKLGVNYKPMGLINQNAEISWGSAFTGRNVTNITPFVADFDNDGITDRALIFFNPQDGKTYWYVKSSRINDKYIDPYTEHIVYEWPWEGMNENHILAVGDYNGDGASERTIVSKDFGWLTVGGGLPFEWRINDISKHSKTQLLMGDYDGDGVQDMGFIDLANRKVYIHSSAIDANGINVTINHLYSFPTSAYLAKKKNDEDYFNASQSVLPTPSITVSGRTLKITGIPADQKVRVLNMKGKSIESKIVTMNGLNVLLPTSGKFIIQVGNFNQVISVN